MPDEPQPADDSKELDAELEKELDEFEAELLKTVKEDRGPGDRETEGGPAPQDEVPDLATREDIEARLSKAIKDAEAYLGPIRPNEVDPELLESAEKDPGRDEISKFHEQHPDLDARLKELERRAHRANHSRRSQADKRALGSRAEGDSARGLGVGLSVAYAIIGGPLFGAFIGWLIDRNQESKTWTGICVTIGAVLGIALGLMILNRSQQDR